jgi:hypothetical protein
LAARGVQQPPKSAARGLALWAVDLWPYVNGKALVNGIKLLEMELSDMLDVIHYFYEEDLNYASVEQAKMSEARRVTLFKELYKQEYKYASTSAADRTAASFAGQYDFDDPVPFDPTNAPTKPYVPPTEMDADAMDPFGGVLDAPVNY